VPKNFFKKNAQLKILSFWVIFSFFLLLEISYFAARNELSTRLPFGIEIAKADYSLVSSEIVADNLEKRITEFLAQPLQFQTSQKIIEISPAKIDLKISWHDLLATSQRALVSFESLTLPVKLNEKRLRRILLNADRELEYSATDARVFLEENEKLKIQTEKTGRKTDFHAIAAAIRKNASILHNELIEIETKNIPAKISVAELEPFRKLLTKIIDVPLVLSESNYRRFKINLANRISWFDFGVRYILAKKTIELSNHNRFKFLDNQPIIFLRRAEIEKFVQEELNPLVADLPHGVKISQTIDGNIEFDGIAKNGRLVDATKLFKKIERALTEETRDILIPFRQIAAPVKITKQLAQLGITELIGESVTNYAGSPRNRQYNIRVAADKLNGKIIASGKEFSFIRTLGPILYSTGYRDELVIKKGDVIPEVGGGVCQVSTTFFRTALAAGLPITAQKPHTLKVHYYDPPGLDATIYPGSADLRFLNDTGYPILIQAVVENTSLHVNFFGYPDGRYVKLVGPFFPNGEPITNLARSGLRMFWERKITTAANKEITERYNSFYRLHK